MYKRAKENLGRFSNYVTPANLLLVISKYSVQGICGKDFSSLTMRKAILKILSSLPSQFLGNYYTSITIHG